MKYLVIDCSNGYCGCEERFLTEADNDSDIYEIGDDVLWNCYCFAEPDSRFADLEDEDSVMDYEEGLEVSVVEVSKEKYDALKSEGYCVLD